MEVAAEPESLENVLPVPPATADKEHAPGERDEGEDSTGTGSGRQRPPPQP